MVFHVTWGDPGLNYVGVESVQEMDAALDAITELVNEPAVMVVDYEGAMPATQLRLLVGHPDRSAIRWSSFGDPVCRMIATDERLAPWPVPIPCDVEGVTETLAPRLTRVTPVVARRAAHDFVAERGARPGSVPLWTPLAAARSRSGHA